MTGHDQGGRLPSAGPRVDRESDLRAHRLALSGHVVAGTARVPEAEADQHEQENRAGEGDDAA